MASDLDHANHQFSDSDGPILYIMVATITSSLWVSYISIFTALGSGLASTPDSRVPYISNVLWGISGYAIIACAVLFFATLIKRNRLLGYLLGAVVLGAGVALAAGRILNWQENDSGRPLLEAISWPTFIIPVLASIVIFWKSRELLPWGPVPDTD